MKAVFRKRGRTLVPVDEEGLNVLAHIQNERDVIVEVKQRRNPAHHRLLFCILKFIVTHSDLYATTDAALIGLKIALGFVTPFIDVTGKTFFVPRSISF